MAFSIIKSNPEDLDIFQRYVADLTLQKFFDRSRVPTRVTLTASSNYLEYPDPIHGFFSGFTGHSYP